MAFDAGSVEASLTLRTEQFNRDMDAAEARVKRFEDEKHTIKVAAVFDQSSFSKARQQFAQLDQAISKDAMSRLRSNPQGSVLGALNALFSPHPVTGAPSPTQAAQQGLLGKIVAAPGGGGVAGPAKGRAQAAPTVGQVLGSNAPPAQSNAGGRVSTVGLPQDNTIKTTDKVSVTGLPGDNSITTTDRVNTVGLPKSGTTINTTDTVTQRVIPARDPVTGRFVGADTESTNTVKEKLDPAAAAKTESDAKASGDRSGKSWGASFLSSVRSLIGSGGGGGGGGGSPAGGKDAAASGGSSGGFASGLLNGIGPGILGTSFKTASIAGLVGAGIGGIPALVAGTAPLAVGAAGAGILAAGAKTLIGSKNTKQDPNAQGPLFDQAQAAGKALQDMVTSAASGLVAPLKNLFAQVPALAKQVEPALAQVFSGTASLIQPVVTGLVNAVKAIGPGLSDAFKATGPLLQPLITGLGQLVGGLMPGLVAMLKAAGPAVQVVSQFFASLGTNLGQMFRDFSTVIGPSSVILKALLDVVTGLLPVIGGLARDLAGALGPAFTAFAGAIKALEPFLVTIGKIFAQFAGAVLTDLAGGLQLVASILKAVAPAFNTLATALGQVFNTLESKGGFAQLGNVLEGLATPIGNLITKLVNGLAPAIPPLLSLFSQFVNVISTVGVQVLTALIPPITQLAETALGALVKVLPLVLPVLTNLLSAFTADAGTLISQVGGALLNLAVVVLTKLLQAAAPLIPVVLSLVNAFTPLLNVLTPVVATTITAIADAIAALVNAIPAPVFTAAAVAIGAVIGAMKLWALATAGVSAAIQAWTWLTGIAGAVAAFTAAIEGATLAEKALTLAQVALDAVSPLVWIGAAVGLLGALSVALVAVSASSQTVVGEFAQQQQQLGYSIAGYQKLAATISTAADGYQKFAQRSTDAVRGGAAGAAALSQQLTAQSQQVSAAALAMGQRLDALTGTFGVSRTTIEQWASAAGISATKFSGASENVGLLTTQIAAFVNKNAVAVTSTASLSTNISIFGNSVFNATTQLDAFNAIWNTLVGNLLTKQVAITQSKQSFDNLQQSITSNGKASDATSQSFQAYIQQVGASAAALQKSGASVNDINTYLQVQISNLTSLGPLNKQQQADVQALTSFQLALANSTHGLNSEQLTWIQQAEQHLIPDLQAMHADTPAVTGDVNSLANAIAQTGTQSSATAADRAQLIKDLESSGVSAQTAAGFVDGLIKTLGQVPKSVTSNVNVVGSGSGTITFAEQNIKNAQTGLLEFHAAGGLIKGGVPGRDSVLGMLMPGEVVVPAAMVAGGAVDHLRGRLPGFAAGGLVGISSITGAPDWMASAESSAAKSAEGDAAARMIADMQAKIAAEAASVPTVATAGSAGGVIATAMRNMAAARGWTGAEWNALYALEQSEAGFNMTATNPSSGAYGLAQFINGPSEYATYGGDSTTATGQITAMLNYIAQRYGDPIAAEAHEQAYHWYGDGGMISEPVLGRGLHSGARYVLGERGSEMVTPVGGRRGGGATADDIADLLRELNGHMKRQVRATEQVPAGVGAHVGGAINGASADASFRSRYPRSSP